MPALTHVAELQKLDHAVSSDWAAFGELNPIPISDPVEGDESGGDRPYTLMIPGGLADGIIKGMQDLGYAFRLVWTDREQVAHELLIDSVRRDHRRPWKPAVVQCHEKLQND